MNACADRDMAIPRLFDANTPFTIVTGGSELSFLGKEDLGQGCEEEKDSLVQVIAPHLSQVMQHGTAKHVVAEGRGLSPREKNPCVSIIAQAESEDFQEFSPTTTRCLFPQQQLLDKLRSLGSKLILMSDTEDDDFVKATKLPHHHHHHLQRKQRRKPRRRQSQEDGEEPPIIHGLWVQEIDWLKSTGGDTTPSAEIIPPPPLFKDSPSCCCHGDLHADTLDEGCAHICECEDGLDSVETDDTSCSDRGDSDSDGLDLDSESVYTHDSNSSSDDDTQPSEHGVESELTFDLRHMSGFDSHHDTWDCDSMGAEQNTLGLSDSTDMMTTSSCSCYDDLSDADAVLDELRGRVTHTTKLLVSPFFKLLIKQTLNDWKHNVHVNEGLIFHHRLQPSASRYREGQEYHVLHHVQNGSYGDVFCVRDVSTGFECAAKRIPLSHFSSEEVSTWSALNSPRVVELFGAVREGPNVMLFMDLKPACLAQLLKDMNSLPEDLALHYLHQTLGALDHLHHRKVLHLDVKVDNVLLSADCRDTFLCDFGLSETLDDSGWSIKAFRGGAFPGTETHMAPEVAAGERLCAKADVWSSCCMLLHMLNGCHPWTRYYSHPLCLQIVNEPPPLWEVPSNCNNFTAKMFRAGLRKDPDRRVSAKELRRKTTKALRAVGGLSPWSVQTACEILHRSNNQTEDPPRSLSPGIITATTPAAISAPTMYWVSPWRTTAVDEDSSDLQDGDSDVKTHLLTGEWDSQPKSLRDDFTAKGNDWETTSDSDVDIYMGEEELIQEYEGDWEEEEEEEEWDSSVSTEYHQALRGLFPLLQKGQQTNDGLWGSEAELQILRDDIPEGTVIQTASPEPRDDPPSCFSCSETSQVDASEKDSDHSSDDLSSGIFSSCNGHTDEHLDWLVSANQPSSCCFEGVDIWIENVQGECLRIRERRQVKVGHVAVGISDQISANAFTLETLDMKTVSFEDEIRDSCVWLRCVPAPDTCPRWTWRVRDGELQHH